MDVHNCGVLSPLALHKNWSILDQFFVYINDLSNVSTASQLVFLADDSNNIFLNPYSVASTEIHGPTAFKAWD